MKDITKEILKNSDARQGGGLNKLTRLDLLRSRLKELSRELDQSREITTVVISSRGFEQIEAGTLRDAYELLECYNATHTINIHVYRDKNMVMLRLGQKLHTEVSVPSE